MSAPNRSSVCRFARSVGGTVAVISDTRESDGAGLGHVDLMIDAPTGKVWKASEMHSIPVSYDRVPRCGVNVDPWQKAIDDSWAGAWDDVREGVTDCPDGDMCQTCADRRAEAVRA